MNSRLAGELREEIRALARDAERAATLISRMKEERKKLESVNQELERKLREWEEKSGSGDVKGLQERIRRLEKANHDLGAEREEILKRLESVLEKFNLIETA